MMGGMSDEKSFRRSLAGKYAVFHLLCTTLALVLALGGTGDALGLLAGLGGTDSTAAIPMSALGVPMLLLGFPLLDLLSLLSDLVKHWPPAVGVLVFIGTMAGNSYLWGYAVAWAHWRWAGKEP
jgi:hypothetical protein